MYSMILEIEAAVRESSEASRVVTGAGTQPLDGYPTPFWTQAVRATCGGRAGSSMIARLRSHRILQGCLAATLGTAVRIVSK